MAGGTESTFNGGRCSGSDGSHSVILLHNKASESLTNSLISGSSSSSTPSFLGPRSMANFKDGGGRTEPNRLIFSQFEKNENGEEDLDEFFHPPEKKRRLTSDQLQFLEKNFELENKLEPDRKSRLAKEIGLKPRQIAVWFQNRRVRWKTKQLEKDFEVLQSDYGSLKTEYENLVNEKDKLKAQVLVLSEKLLLKEKDEEQPQNEMEKSISGNDQNFKILDLGSKIEDISSDKSDISNEEEDSLEQSLFFSPFIFPKLENDDDDDYSDQPPTTCNFGFNVEDNDLWSWG